MRRLLLRLLIIVSLVLALLLCAWQVRSYWHRDFVQDRRTGGYITSESGRMAILLYGVPFGRPALATKQVTDPSTFIDQEVRRANHPNWGHTGVSWIAGRVGIGLNTRDYSEEFCLLIILPHALVGLTLALPPLVLWAWISRRTRLRRLGEKHCLKCDYDLRGTSSERCPECGTLIADPRVLPT